jgi:proline racemase
MIRVKINNSGESEYMLTPNGEVTSILLSAPAGKLELTIEADGHSDYVLINPVPIYVLDPPEPASGE